MPTIAPEIARMLPRSRRMPMLEGFIYEPRAFWSFGRFTGSAPVGRPANRMTLNREHFYNGEKYPITLLYVTLAPLNYVFDQYAEAGNPATAINFRNDGVSQTDFAQIRIAARQRQHYMKTDHPSMALIPRPRWEPRASEDPSGVIPVGSSSLFNVFRWEYDAPMIIPARGDMEYELSTFLWPGNGLPNTATNPRASIAFEEIGTGPFGGNMRLRNHIELFPTGNPVSWAAELFPADGFGGVVPAQTTMQGVWNPALKFSARQFAAQNKDSDGSIPMTACSVMINQRVYDIAMDNGAAGATTALVASLGTKLGTRARTRHGGTGAWWWRPGAPLALVSPHRTTAQVFEFRRPLTLGPGDSLEVELAFPTPPVVAAAAVNTINQLAVAFCGHACIEA